MPALHGRLGGAAACGDGVGHILPVLRAEVAPAEREPLVAEGLGDGRRLAVGPARRRKPARRSNGGDGGRRRGRGRGRGRRGGRSHGGYGLRWGGEGGVDIYRDGDEAAAVAVEEVGA